MKRVLFTTLLSMLFVISIQAQRWGAGITGEGDAVTKTLDVSSFDGLTLAVSGNVILSKGSQNVEVKGQQNIIDNLEMQIEGGHLKIKFDKNVRRHKELTFYITVPELEKVAISGSGNIKTEDTFTGSDEVYLGISGSGNISFACEAESVSTKISGSGNISVKGTADEMNAQISGSGNVRASELKVEDAMVKISGSGNASVYATEHLEAHTSGSGDIKYKGRPRVKAKSSGSGDIESIN